VVHVQQRSLDLTTWGSSSCPSLPVAIRATGAEIDVSVSRGDPTRVCTADLGPTTSRVAIPAGPDVGAVTRVLVTDVTAGAGNQMTPATTTVVRN
jgi:hypothetical protein